MRLVAPLLAALMLAAGAHALTADRAPGLFASQEPLAFQLRAPFDTLFGRSAHDDDFSVTGSLAYTDANGRAVRIDGIAISVRGNTSKQGTECTFPKLKLRLDSASGRDGSMFDNVDAVKIGTHCGEAPDDQLTRKFGRLANEKSPLREAFVYRLLAIAGVPALQARPARITYEYASGDRPPLVRNAMLLEDTNEARKRLDAGGEISMADFQAADTQLTTSDTVALTFAEAMIGNFDWCLRFTSGDHYRCDASRPLWNILAFKRKGDRALPVMHDFDLSGMVTGSHFWFDRVLNERFSDSASRIEVEVVTQLQHTRSLFARGDLDAARQRFVRHRDEAFAALDNADVDDHGREIIARYLTAFFNAIGTDKAFYRPVIVQAATAYAAAQGATAACPNAATAPVGTLVGPPLDRRGGRVKVELLDALWHWTGPRACSAIRRGPVWVDARAIGTDYPR
jgi:hypothetical protein